MLVHELNRSAKTGGGTRILREVTAPFPHSIGYGRVLWYRV